MNCLTQSITISAGSTVSFGNFIFEEEVTGSISEATGTVRSWDSETKELKIFSFGEDFVVGDVIVGVVKDALPNMTLKKSDVIRAVVVRTCHATRRSNGMVLRFDDNAAVLINNQGEPIGTRIFGPVPRELREKGYAKIISLAPEVL